MERWQEILYLLTPIFCFLIGSIIGGIIGLYRKKKLKKIEFKSMVIDGKKDR